MAPLDASENRIEDALDAALAAIGTPPASWFTAPVFVAGGVPLDNLQAAPYPQLFIQYIRTEIDDTEATTRSHAGRGVWHVFCCSTDQTTVRGNQRIVRSLKADVIRAMFRSEAAIQAAGADLGLWPGIFEYRPDLAPAGAAVGIQEIVAHFHLDRFSDP